MSEIAYEGNLFPMVGPMINAHWQHVFPPGALLGHGSCVTPPPQRCPLFLWEADIPQGEGETGGSDEDVMYHNSPLSTTRMVEIHLYFTCLKVVNDLFSFLISGPVTFTINHLSVYKISKNFEKRSQQFPRDQSWRFQIASYVQLTHK